MAEASSWRTGDVLLDLYEVRDVVHSGGMGLVHRVRHRGWNMDLAVKTPRPALVATAAGRAGFEAEAGTWVGLGPHPHVVSCAYVRRVDGLPCVFAEWVDGGSLATAVRDGRLRQADPRLTLARTLDVAVQVAWGIGHAHEQGVIHQDVKPANIMLDPEWTAKVTDFGLARARAAAGERTTVPPGASLLASYGGMTPAYCSPEQADAVAGATAPLTRTTDVWSWALCVLEMVMGGPPCRYGQAGAEVFGEFLADSGAATLPGSLVDLLWRCLDLRPAARPQRMDEVAAAVVQTYGEVVGEPYPRLRPEPATLLADGLSNQALSLLDLGRTAEAEEQWRWAMDADPHHPHTVYNWALYRWRHGRMTDEQAVSELETTRAIRGGDWRADHLLGFVHLERGDDDQARTLLAEAPDVPEVAAALAELAVRPAGPAVVRPPGHHSAVTALAVSDDGGLAVSGAEDGRLRVWSPIDGTCRRELTGAAGRITAVAVTGDGRLGLVAHGDGPVELWDLDGGSLLRQLPGDPGGVTSVALNADGRVGATAHRGGLVQVWDLDTGAGPRQLSGHPPPVTDVVLSPDGDLAVSADAEASTNGTVLVWDVATARPRHRLVRSDDGRLTGIENIVLGRDGRIALLASWQGPLRMWEPATDRVRGSAPNNLPRYSWYDMSRDGTVALSVGESDQDPLRIWETDSGRCLRTVDLRVDQFGRTGLRVAVSGNGRLAVLGDSYGAIEFRPLPATGFRAGWSYARPTSTVELGRAEAEFRGALDRAARLVEQGTPQQAAAELRSARAVPGFARHPELRRSWAEVGRSGHRSDLLGIWQRYVLSGTWIFTRPVNLAFSQDGELVVAGGADARIRVFEVATGACLATFADRATGNTHTVEVSADGQLAFSADYGGFAHVWNLADGGHRQLRGDRSQVTSAAMSADGRYALVGDGDGALGLWEPRTGRLVRTLLGHDGPVGTVAMTTDGKRAASAGRTDRTVRLWEPPTGRILATVAAGLGTAGLRFSPDGRHLYVNGVPDLTAWDTRTGRRSYSIDSGGWETPALSADGRLGLTSGPLGTVQVWEAATGRVRHRLPDRAEAFAVSADGRYAVTGGFDRTLRIWDLRTGRCEHTLDGHPTTITMLRFSPDNRHVVSADATPAIRLWELDWDYEFGTGSAR